MNIFVIAVFPPIKAAEADHAYQICRHIAATGVNVSVVTQQDSATLDHENVTVYPIMQNWSWREMPRLVRRFTRSKPDAVLLYFIGYIYNHHPMVTFVPTLVRKLLPGVPCVTLISHVFGSSSADASLLARLLHKALRFVMGRNVNYNFGTIFRDSHRLIVLSESHKDLIAGQLPSAAGKCILIPPPPIMPIAPDLEQIRLKGREQLDVRSTDTLVVYFGNICPNKGLETLLAAFSIASRTNQNLRLAVIGRIPDDQTHYARKLQDMCCQLGLKNIVRFTGGFPFDSDQASVFLRAADLCVLPFDDGVQLNNSSFAAAAAHRLPIITTQGTFLEQVFIDRTNVVVCPPKDPEALASAIDEVVQDTCLRERLKQEVLITAQTWFSWESVMEKLLIALSS